MRKRVSVTLRLFVMLAMALGLATLMSSSAAAQEPVQCQTIIDGVIDQADCTVEVGDDGQCQVVVNGEIQQNIVCNPEGCPQQLIDAEGNIFQFQCSGVTQPTSVPATTVPTTAPATATTVPATTVPGTATTVPATDVPATNVPDEEEEEPVDVLPDTGQGSSSGQSNTATMFFLGVMAVVLTLGALSTRLRSNR